MQIMRGLIERAGDKFLKIRTYSYSEDPTLPAGSNPYSPAPYPTLWAMLNSVPRALRSGSFVDYGCGKGRILAAASMAGFNRVIGVEMSAPLVADARENAVNGGYRHEIACADATTYEIPNGCTVCCLANPFVGEPLRLVVARMAKHFSGDKDHRILAFYNTRKLRDAAISVGVTLHQVASGRDWASFTVRWPGTTAVP